MPLNETSSLHLLLIFLVKHGHREAIEEAEFFYRMVLNL